LSLQQEYDSLKRGLDENKVVTAEFSEEKRKAAIELPSQFLPQRQEKILEILKEKGRAQVWEIQKIFPEVTKRTLRRDFEHMLAQGLIERIGERNETFYRLKVDRA